MDIALGDILESIALLCSPKDSRLWNGMVKIHLKNPSKDVKALLTGKRVFVMEFDDSIKVPKIFKSFDNTTPKELLAIRVKGDNFKMVVIHRLMAEVVFTSFYCGEEFEIIQVNKNKKDNFAYLTTASLEQCKKVIMHQVLFNCKIFMPIMASARVVSKKEIQKRNCLTLIVKDCDLYYSANEVTATLKQFIGNKNVVNIYFKDRNVEKDQHATLKYLTLLSTSNIL